MVVEIQYAELKSHFSQISYYVELLNYLQVYMARIGIKTKTESYNCLPFLTE